MGCGSLGTRGWPQTSTAAGRPYTPNTHTVHTPYTPHAHPIHTPYTPNTHPIHTPYTPNTHPIHTPYTPNTHPIPTPYTPHAHPTHTPYTPNTHPIHIPYTQVRPADDAATHPGRPPGSAVQPVRGRRTTASPSVPRVRASTVYGETHQLPESRGLSAGLVFLSVCSPACGGPSLVRAPLSFAPCMVLSAPPHLGHIPSECVRVCDG